MKVPFTLADAPQPQICILTNRLIERGEPVARTPLGLILPVILTKKWASDLLEEPAGDQLAFAYVMDMLTSFASRQQVPLPGLDTQQQIVAEALSLLLDKLKPGESGYIHELMEGEGHSAGVADLFWLHLFRVKP